MTRIALDGMGGDKAPDVVVQGLKDASKIREFKAFLVGDEKALIRAVDKFQLRGKVEIVHAAEVAQPGESPSMVVRKKQNSSIGVGIRMQKEGKADAFISAGSTGAVMAFSLLTLGRIKGVNRPAIATFFPTKQGFTLVLDVGANSDCKPENLLQFAIMGSLYLSDSFKKEKPRVALLSMGEEASKGNDLTLSAHELLKSTPLVNFIGNIEGNRILDGLADVVVCDGFVGNAVLKFGESIVEYVSQLLRQSITEGLRAKMGGLILRPSLKRMVKRMNYEEYGGAPLLGIDGVTFICHGKSTPRAIRSAIVSTCDYVEGRVNEHIKEQLLELAS
jgi:glycerol-3-phosphate acyltransferase PlsX